AVWEVISLYRHADKTKATSDALLFLGKDFLLNLFWQGWGDPSLRDERWNDRGRNYHCYMHRELGRTNVPGLKTVKSGNGPKRQTRAHQESQIPRMRVGISLGQRPYAHELGRAFYAKEN